MQILIVSFSLGNHVVIFFGCRCNFGRILRITMDGTRFTNHSGRLTCAKQLHESGTFDEQTMMSRTGHRSTALCIYKRASSTLVKVVSDALLPPIGGPESKI